MLFWTRTMRPGNLQHTRKDVWRCHGWRAMLTLNDADTLNRSSGSGVLLLPNPLLALTLQQPWASAVRDLGKRTENRSWPAPKRAVGSIIAIHAGQTFHEDAADWLAARTGRMLTRSNVPLGAVVALARVIEVVQESSDDMWFFGPYGWVLDDVVALTPVPCRGRPHLWTVPERVRQAIELQWPLNMSDKD